jgi:hypothetical protein
MGLDVVELVMEIEEHFSVTIPDDEAGRILCVGDLYLFLLRRTGGPAVVPCPTARAFYTIRRVFMHSLGAERGQVRPATQLRHLIPVEVRETACPRLATALGLPDFPDPEPTYLGPTRQAFRRALRATMTVTSLLYLLLVLLAGAAPLVVLLLLKFAAIPFLCLIFLVLWHEARLRQGPLPVIRDLVIRLAPQVAPPPSGELWAELVAFLAVYFRVPPEEVRPERRFDELPRR